MRLFTVLLLIPITVAFVVPNKAFRSARGEAHRTEKNSIASQPNKNDEIAANDGDSSSVRGWTGFGHVGPPASPPAPVSNGDSTGRGTTIPGFTGFGPSANGKVAPASSQGSSGYGNPVAKEQPSSQVSAQILAPNYAGFTDATKQDPSPPSPPTPFFARFRDSNAKAPSTAAPGLPSKPNYSGFGYAPKQQIPSPAFTPSPPTSPTPIFSGFGHADTKTEAAAPPPPPPPSKPNYSGFGSTRKQSPSAPTEQPPPVAYPATPAPPMPSTPIFSALGHLNSKGEAPVVPASSPAPNYSGFGHAVNTSPPVTPVSPPSSFAGFGDAGASHSAAPATPFTPGSSPRPNYSGFGQSPKKTPPPSVPPKFYQANGDLTPAAAAEPAPQPVATGWTGFGPVNGDAVATPQATSSESNVMKSLDAKPESTKRESYNTQSIDLDPDIEEAKQYLHAARDKVLELRDELDSLRSQQVQLVDHLQEELNNQEKEYEAALGSISKDYESYKTDAEGVKRDLEAKLIAKEDQLYKAVAKRDVEIAEAIEQLNIELETAKQEALLAQNFTERVVKEKQELQSNYEDLKARFVSEHVEMEDRLEMEQTARQADVKRAYEIMKQVKEDLNQQIREARAEGRVMSEAVRSEMSNRLWQKETVLQKTELALKRTIQEKTVLEQKVEQYEWEREDLSSLTKQTAKVAKNKTLSRLQRARNFFRRNKLG